MSRFSIAFLAIGFLSIAMVCQPQSLPGDWQGTLTFPQGNLPLIFHLSEGGAGAADSPNQNANGMPLTYSISGNQVNINIPSVQATYKATVNGDQMSGTFSQNGANLPLQLSKAGNSAAAAPAQSAPGAAEGTPTRPCTSRDLDGTYVLVDFHEFPVLGFTYGAQSAPYRFLAFFPPSTWSEMAFNMPPASPAKLMDFLRLQMQGRSFTLQPDGRILLNSGKAVQFAGSCAISLHTENGFQENDLILAGNQAAAPSELHELFRRWTGGAVPKAVSTFDPAPSATHAQPHPAAELPDVQPSMPDKPVPLRVSLMNGAGGSPPVVLVVTNESHAPVSAFMLVFRGAQTGQRWKESDVDACLEHLPAWQPGQRWTKEIGLPIEVGNIQIFLGAAIFSDGSTWGNPHRLAKLKARRGSCQWPGS